MTILAVVKTATDLIIAADSKVTTYGLGGRDAAGNPVLLEQNYDFGTKIAFSTGKHWTAAVAGQGSFGDVQVLDVVGQQAAGDFTSRSVQEADLTEFVNKLAAIRSASFGAQGLPEGQWPFTELLFCSSDPEGRGVRAWHTIYGSATPEVREVLELPGVYLLGFFEYAFSLLYGFNLTAVPEVAATLQTPADNITTAFRQKYLAPINKLNVAVMPIQDAMELAVFLVKVEIQMERFLPGTPKCGGPIDIAVVRGRPQHEVMWFPGKEIRHPGRP